MHLADGNIGPSESSLVLSAFTHTRLICSARHQVGETCNTLIREILIPAIRKGTAPMHLRVVFCNLSRKIVMEMLDALKENTTLVGFTCLANFGVDDDEDEAIKRAAIETEAPLKVFQNEELPEDMKRARVALALVRGTVRVRRPGVESQSLKYATTDVVRLVVDSLV
jgi:hypothetical protein